mmetsp:Transcript_12438/g.12207  ORF Transcript_12438/g.12207 Transcript_12438/m.12207 type:complete len:84 (+) Transcript_12438:354-605(+)
MCTFSCLIEPQSRRAELSLFMLPKIFEAIWIFLEKRKLVYNIKNGDVLLFSFCFGLLMSVFHSERENMKGSYSGVLKMLMGEN